MKHGQSIPTPYFYTSWILLISTGFFSLFYAREPHLSLGISLQNLTSPHCSEDYTIQEDQKEHF